MIYLKRILFILLLFPVTAIYALVGIVEVLTFPLKLLISFILYGTITNVNIAWFDFIINPLINLLNKLTPDITK